MARASVVGRASHRRRDPAVKGLALGALRAYKRYVSPLMPPACRYTPTCSEYALEAIERYGALRGGGLALRRLLSCNPLSRGGYDPVR
jgi:uncharacterized protein